MIIFKSKLRKKAELMRWELYMDLALYNESKNPSDKQRRAKHHIRIAIETIDKLLQDGAAKRN
jgi:hypothetical protein